MQTQEQHLFPCRSADATTQLIRCRCAARPLPPQHGAATSAAIMADLIGCSHTAHTLALLPTRVLASTHVVRSPIYSTAHQLWVWTPTLGASACCSHISCHARRSHVMQSPSTRWHCFPCVFLHPLMWFYHVFTQQPISSEYGHQP